MVRKFIYLIIFLTLISTVSAWYCQNPTSQLKLCGEYQDIPKEICCPENGNYGMTKNQPLSQEDCMENFITEEYDERCEEKCCFDLTYNCEMKPEVACTNKILDSCEDPLCEQGCCCMQGSSTIGSELTCEGSFFSEITDREACIEKCSRLLCFEGCQETQPYLCENQELIKDCTGGDGIVGNGNDCGCPSGEICTVDGCKNEPSLASYSRSVCLDKGYLWEGSCVRECSEGMYSNDGVCEDECEITECGTHSSCSKGECVCEEGFVDSDCKAYEERIDFDGSGCVSYDPCEEKDNTGVIIGGGILLFIVALLIFLKFRRH